uniref:Similar to PLDP1 (PHOSPHOLIPASE D ZETA1) n=1 Tax=Arundo donax TaxID=35708 RepID=A0A0A9E414_ARUDO
MTSNSFGSKGSSSKAKNPGFSTTQTFCQLLRQQLNNPHEQHFFLRSF